MLISVSNWQPKKDEVLTEKLPLPKKVDKTRIRRTSFVKREIDLQHDEAERVATYEISIASQEDTNDDWIGEAKIMNLKNVRNRNFMHILEKTNSKARRGYSTALDFSNSGNSFTKINVEDSFF